MKPQAKQRPTQHQLLVHRFTVVAAAVNFSNVKLYDSFLGAAVFKVCGSFFFVFVVFLKQNNFGHTGVWNKNETVYSKVIELLGL